MNSPGSPDSPAATGGAGAGSPPREGLAAELEALLRAALEPVSLTLRDDSAKHAGHAGAREGAHFAVRVVSSRFAGLRMLQRHRLVYDAAAPLLPGRIHALQIDARTPDEA